MDIKGFYDQETGTISYVVADQTCKICAVIDSVLDFDMFAARTSTQHADQLIAHIQENGYVLEWILETHVHADHLTAAHYIQQKLGGKIAIGKRVLDVLAHWVPLFQSHEDTPLDGSQFDKLWEDGEHFTIGDLNFQVIYTPGHTPACVMYVGPGCAFVGDTIFMPHLGTARTDFPGGSAHKLYESIQRIFSLPDETILYMCHEYPEDGEEAQWLSTVGEEKAKNKFIHHGIDLETYIHQRESRDKTLRVPHLILPSLQVNLRAGHLGQNHSNGIIYLKTPLNQL